MLNILQIKNILRHRYPFLLIDKVIEYEEEKRAKGVKCVTINEAFFQGHFPDEPIMPGVLILESMAQLAAIVAGKKEDYIGFLTSIYNARFLKPVVPGDQLILESEVMQKVKNLVRVKSTARVSDALVAKAELGFVVFKKEEFNKKFL
jgi:3-hydroxyacyl-[acyl-carrier-protein] dehydratase